MRCSAAPPIADIGEIDRIAVRFGMTCACGFFPFCRIDRRKEGVALRLVMNLGDFETIRPAQPLRKDVGAADHHFVISTQTELSEGEVTRAADKEWCVNPVGQAATS